MNPAQTAPSLERLTKLQALTQEYSRFSDAKAGLTLIVAAALLVALRFLPNPTNFHGVLYVVIAALIWLAARARINQQLYQRFGSVQEKQKNRDILDGDDKDKGPDDEGEDAKGAEDEEEKGEDAGVPPQLLGRVL